MRFKTRSMLLIVPAILFGAALSFNQAALAQTDSNPTAKNKNTAAEGLPLKQLRTFVEILNRVKQGYVEDIGDKKLLENAIRGMLDGLDPHSAYLNKEEFRQISITTSGKFGGLGIEVQKQNGFLRVVAPIDDTPASRADIRPGDLIVRIGDTAVKGMSLTDAVQKLRGEIGSNITLTLVRDGRDGPFKVTLKRSVIRVRSVKSRMLDPGYGYVRITQFSNGTGDAVVSAIKRLQKKAGKGGLQGIVLDLRNNPGGVLSAAVDVSDTFINSGGIVSIRGRAANTDQQFDAKPGDMLNGAPIVVLVNGGSASASEIVSGALQDDSRAVIMGTRTFGKGSVQTIIPLANGAALKLTTARYYTPSGRSIQGEGIQPDVGIQNVKVTASKASGIAPFSEADLAGALSNDTETPTEAAAAAKAKARKSDLAASDYPLYEALNLLKGLRILQSHGQSPMDKMEKGQ